MPLRRHDAADYYYYMMMIHCYTLMIFTLFTMPLIITLRCCCLLRYAAAAATLLLLYADAAAYALDFSCLFFRCRRFAGDAITMLRLPTLRLPTTLRYDACQQRVYAAAMLRAAECAQRVVTVDELMRRCCRDAATY